MKALNPTDLVVPPGWQFELLKGGGANTSTSPNVLWQGTTSNATYCSASSALSTTGTSAPLKEIYDRSSLE